MIMHAHMHAHTHAPVFEIKVLFCAPSGRTGSYNVHPAACPPVHSYNISLKKRAHTGRTSQKNVRPTTEMCAPGAVCTLNFEHCARMHTHMHAHTLMHARTCTHAHTLMHTHTHTHALTHTHSRRHTHTHTASLIHSLTFFG